MFYTYVIKNENSKIYIGQTIDWRNRLKYHNGISRNKLGSYTRINRGNWKIVYLETFKTRIEALKREKYLKSHIGRNWLKEKILGR